MRSGLYPSVQWALAIQAFPRGPGRPWHLSTIMQKVLETTQHIDDIYHRYHTQKVHQKCDESRYEGYTITITY